MVVVRCEGVDGGASEPCGSRGLYIYDAAGGRPCMAPGCSSAQRETISHSRSTLHLPNSSSSLIQNSGFRLVCRHSSVAALGATELPGAVCFLLLIIRMELAAARLLLVV